MRTVLALVALCSLQSCVAPGDAAERQAVLATVQGFFDYIASPDQETGLRLMVPDGVFVTVREQDGKRVLGSFTNAEAVERMRKATRQMREAFTEDPIVLVDGNVATVWGRYRFEIDGELSHTGVDAFQLVKTDDGWKLSGGAYSLIR